MRNTSPERRKLLAGTALTTLALGMPALRAQELPSTLNLIVPNVAGGTADILARLVAASVAEVGLRTVVENVAGASGGIAQARVINSRPDGGTAMVASVNNVLLDVIHNTRKMDEMAPLAGTATVPMVLVGRNSLPAKTVDELVAYARSADTKLTIAGGGTGTLPHLGAVALQNASKAGMTYVPYKGAPQILNNMIGDHIDLAVLLLPAALSNIRGGMVRAYGLFAAQRSAVAEEIPSLMESTSLRDMGPFPDYWSSVFVSAKTPEDIQARLAEIFGKAVSRPEFKKQLVTAGSDPMSMGPAELRKQMQADARIFKEIIDTNKLTFS